MANESQPCLELLLAHAACFRRRDGNRHLHYLRFQVDNHGLRIIYLVDFFDLIKKLFEHFLESIKRVTSRLVYGNCHSWRGSALAIAARIRSNGWVSLKAP